MAAGFSAQQEPVTFEDITVSFSKEQWEYLDEEQKELYREVMKNNYETLISLGADHKSIDPEVLSRITEEEEPCVGDPKEREDTHANTGIIFSPILLSRTIFDMDVIISQRGAENWVHEGYRYRCDRSNADGSSSWRCVRRNCVGRRKRLLDGSSLAITAHVHAPDNAKIAAEKMMADIRQLAVNTVEKPRQIIHGTTTGSSLEAAKLLPSYTSIQRTIQRKRKRGNMSMGNPRSVQEILIPDHLKVTMRGEHFLLWDSGESDENRIFIFSTQANINILEQNGHWFMDGTFKVAPELIVQMFTIHAFVDHRALPMVFVLLNSKTEEEYERILRKLLESRSTLSPLSILMDFERASLQAVSRVFPNSSVSGCLFHLGQSLWRKIQDEGLTSNYRDDENVRLYAKMLLALSFVPPENVGDCFEELDDKRPDELQPVYDYWEDHYIGRRRRNYRSPPTFPISLWNMRSRVEDGLPRTNDSVEGWHHAFQSSVSCQHASPYKLIEHFQRAQDRAEHLHAQFLASNRAAGSGKSKYVKVTQKLTALLPTYGHRPVLEYLTCVAHNIEL
uniref:Uncharacterized protein LOC117354520 isoform X1 n=1 Tax=Geotrypetes seraphini TaxID=260995 RepID=A0A6P8PH45_GEOSA|nr:uncharacterized protein LOC117354520 isoform X1 [Geotrypetes seraphini]